MPDSKRPNFLVIWGDDIGITNLSCYSDGLMGYRTPNIDRIADEGMRFTDSYGEQSCTAGRSSFITGQSVFRTGLSKVGVPGADVGLQAEDPTIAELLKPLGYATGPVTTVPGAAQGGEGRLVSVRRQLLHALPPRRATSADDRHRNEPHRLPLRPLQRTRGRGIAREDRHRLSRLLGACPPTTGQGTTTSSPTRRCARPAG